MLAENFSLLLETVCEHSLQYNSEWEKFATGEILHEKCFSIIDKRKNEWKKVKNKAQQKKTFLFLFFTIVPFEF